MEKLPLAVGRARRFGLVASLAAMTALLALIALAAGGSGLGVDLQLVVWGLGVILVPYGAWTAGGRIRRRWNAFELAIGPQTLRCAARGYGRVTIRFDEITSLTEGAAGLDVRAAGSGQRIFIPNTVEGFLDARARLAARHAIAGRADAFLWCAGLFAVGLLLLGTAWDWGSTPGLAAGVVATQSAAAYAIGVEVRWHPRMARPQKWGALVAIAAAAALPVVGLVVREIFLGL